MSELKPCPFCGGKEIGHRHSNKTGIGYVCMTCETTGPFIYGDAEYEEPWAEAEEAWNTRAPEAREADLKAKLEKVCTALRNLRNECSGKPRTDMLLQLIKEADEALT